MEYYISPPEKTSWSMSPSDFVSHLVKHWPSVKIRETHHHPDFPVEWEIEMPGGPLMGEFYLPLSGVNFNGYTFEDLAAFALWFRSLVPPQQPLLFFEEGYNWDMELKPNTTAQELVFALNGE